MSAEESALDALRAEIDEIDNALLDLLQRRGEVARAIRDAKGPAGGIFRPGREAAVLRRLLARHRGSLPKAAVVRLWREIFAAATSLQGRFAVAVHSSDGDQALRTLARDHFGSLTPIAPFSSALGVVRAVTEGEATVGVFPLPQGDDREPWWPHLARVASATPRVVARLPFAAQAGSGAEALVIALSPVEASGHDCGYLIAESDDQLSRSALRGLLTACDLVVRDIQVVDQGGGRWLNLIEVEGLLPADDRRLTRFVDRGEAVIHQIWPLGGYAVPLTAKELAPAKRDLVP